MSTVENVFHAVIDLPANEREAYLTHACGGDPGLYAEVSSLISAYASNEGFIESPALNLGFRLLSKQSQQSLLNTEIGSYKIISHLGRGGMGEVFLAEDLRLGRKVALKFLSPEFVGDAWAKRQMIKEAQAAAMLDHPNICPVYGMEEHGEHMFIVMQYVEGETLSQRINNGSLPAGEAVPIAKQIVAALDEAHAHGIIHRDIKPTNIMVTPTRQVKVLDFGLAKTVHQKKFAGLTDDNLSQFSVPGHRAGTVSYMSPEQLRGESLDYRSDIFSVGTVLYELGCGKNPFAQKSEAETITAILTIDPPPLKRLSVDVPDVIDRLAQKCLKKNLEDRYQSATELLLAFEIEETPTHKFFPLGMRWVALAALFAAILIAVLLSYLRPLPVRTLAILPFANQTGDPAMEYLSEGMGNNLIDRLSFDSRMRVLPPTAVSGYKGRNNDPTTVGRELNVDAVMLGNMFKEGDGIILETRLVSTSDGLEVWRTRSSMNLTEILQVQRNLSAKVAASLSGALEKNGNKTIGQTDNPDAFRLYLLGRNHWEKGRIDQAIICFSQATELDPVFALAWAGLADSYGQQPTVAYGSVDTAEVIPKARAAARKALEMGEALPEAHISMGLVKMRFDWEWSEAEEHFKRAIALDPYRAAAHVSYASLLTNTGRFDEAIVETNKAKDLDPFNPVAVMSLGRAYYRARDFDRSIDYLSKVLQENPDNNGAAYVLGYAYLKKGQLSAAIDLFEKMSITRKWLAAAPLGFAYAKAGQTDKALQILGEIEKQARQQAPGEKKIPAQERAIVYIGLGNKDQAFFWLEKAFEERFPSIIALNTDPIFDDLRSDPRFANLARRIHLIP